MNAEHTVRKILSTHGFVLKFTWRISRKRVILQFLYEALMEAQFLFFSFFFFREVLNMISDGVTYARVMLFLWSAIGCFMLKHLFDQFFQKLLLPVSDVKLYDGINRLLYEKACQVDLRCFEDSEFYNQYMLAIRQAQTQIPAALHNICDGITTTVYFVVTFLLVFSLDAYAVLFLLFPLVGNFMFNRLLIGRVFRMDRENIAFQRIADYVNRTVHLAEYAKEIRLSNVFSLLRRQYARSVDSIHRTIDRYAGRNMLYYFLFQILTFSLLLELGNMYGGYRTLVTGSMTFATFAIFQGALCSATWAALYSSEAVMQCVKDSLYIEQIQSFLEYEPRIPEDTDGDLPDLAVRSIEFDHVWFGYQTGEWILKDICLTIKSGQSTAIVGYNGAGKSTLIKLLLRFYDPDRGRILLNGADIRTYNLRAYRALFSTAFQDGKIFADTVAENILMGRHGTPQEDARIVWDALKRAGMAEEVAAFPMKEHTILTKEFNAEGMLLSGGQNQKIIAARAFAKDTPILVFDEPSSALDPLAEHALFASIRDYSRGRILFCISHRLSSTQDADTVLFLENGRITERGSHEQLMREGGSYAGLYRVQAQNYRAQTDL